MSTDNDGYPRPRITRSLLLFGKLVMLRLRLALFTKGRYEGMEISRAWNERHFYVRVDSHTSVALPTFVDALRFIDACNECRKGRR